MLDFAALFGRRPSVRADAPGRVNLIGEHTDYNGGFVLPIAIPQRTGVELAARSDRVVRVASTNFGADQVLEFTLGEERPGRGWLDYVQGVARLLEAAGNGLSGFDGRISSSIPPGSGLASSAALTVSLLRGLRQLFNLDLADVDLARLAQGAENDFVGARVGVMDPLAAALADQASALFIDTRDLSHRKLPLPAESEVVVVSSGISHSHATGEYNLRREECERARGLLGLAQLRDLTDGDEDRVAGLPEPLNRRVLHVMSENARVLEAVEAMLQGNPRLLGWLLFASHESLRVDYEVSTPELDLLVELAREEPTVFGARLTGGGFGGSIIALVQRSSAAAVGESIAKRYADRTSCRPAVLVPSGSASA